MDLTAFNEKEVKQIIHELSWNRKECNGYLANQWILVGDIDSDLAYGTTIYKVNSYSEAVTLLSWMKKHSDNNLCIIAYNGSYHVWSSEKYRQKLSKE